jgi:hypothetical protein
LTLQGQGEDSHISNVYYDVQGDDVNKDENNNNDNNNNKDNSEMTKFDDFTSENVCVNNLYLFFLETMPQHISERTSKMP